MINYVIINGVNSNTITGLAINELPPITKPLMRTTTDEIDGRDGDIITKLGYSAYDKTITIGLWGTGYDVNSIISFFNKEGTITFSNEADKYYNFTMLEQFDIESLLRFKTATITFHCQPFKYPITETPIEIEYEYIEQDNVESATLNNTNGNTHLDISLKGNTSQTGTPTPSTPIPVNVVSGDNEVVVCGKNLFDKNGNLTNGYLKNDGTIQSSSGFKVSDYIDVSQFSNITISGNSGQGELNCFYDSSKAFISGGGTGSSTTKAYSVPNNAKYFRATISDSSLDGYQIESGSSSSQYEPYQSQTYHITLPNGMELCKIGDYQDYFTKNSGENLFDVSSFEAQLVSGKILNDSGVEINDASSTYSKYVIPVKANTTYYRKGAWQRMYVYDKNMTLLTRGSAATGFNSSFTVEQDGYIGFQISNSYWASNKGQEMINMGSTPLPYEPYGTGQWCKYNAIGKYVYNNNLTFNVEDTNTIGFLTPILNITPSLSDNALSQISLCNIMGTKPLNYTGLSGTTSTYKIRVYIAKSIAPTQQDAKDLFANKELTIYYVLATPYLSLIEDTTLINQLDNIQNAMSYEGQTNVSQVNNDKPFIMDLIAMKDGTDEVVVNNIGNIYSKPTIALEGTGDINIYLDGTQMLKATLTDKMTIDTNNLEAYNPDTMTLLNRQLVGDISKFTLASGNNTIKVDGNLTKATITSYTRWL